MISESHKILEKTGDSHYYIVVPIIVAVTPALCFGWHLLRVLSLYMPSKNLYRTKVSILKKLIHILGTAKTLTERYLKYMVGRFM